MYKYDATRCNNTNISKITLLYIALCLMFVQTSTCRKIQFIILQTVHKSCGVLDVKTSLFFTWRQNFTKLGNRSTVRTFCCTY